MLTVLATSTDLAYTTLAAVKEWLNIATSASSDDTKLNNLILRATAAIEQLISFPLRRQRYEETLPGYGRVNLMLSRTPIVSIDEIWQTTSSQDVLDPSEYSVDEPNAGFVFRKSGWRWTAVSGFGLDEFMQPGSETPSFLVRYTAGYILGGSGSSDPRTFPYDVEQAVIDTVAAWYRGAGRDPSVTSKRVGDLALTYEPIRVGTIPPSATELLEAWKRIK